MVDSHTKSFELGKREREKPKAPIPFIWSLRPTQIAFDIRKRGHNHLILILHSAKNTNINTKKKINKKWRK